MIGYQRDVLSKQGWGEVHHSAKHTTVQRIFTMWVWEQFIKLLPVKTVHLQIIVLCFIYSHHTQRVPTLLVVALSSDVRLNGDQQKLSKFQIFVLF